jgi:hypothetical protein
MTVGCFLEDAQKRLVVSSWGDQGEQKGLVLEPRIVEDMQWKCAGENDSQSVHSVEDQFHVSVASKESVETVVHAAVNNVLHHIAQILVDMRENDELGKVKVVTDFFDEIVAQTIHGQPSRVQRCSI